MSIQYIRYVCPNCGKSTKENNLTQPRQCALCKKVICHHCSPKGFCETCLTSIPEDGKRLLDKTFTQRKVLVGFIWTFLILGFASLALVITFGLESFRANYSFAETLQTVFMIIGGVVFVGFCPIALMSAKMTRKIEATLSDVANIARQKAYQTNMPIQNVGILTDHELLYFKTEVERNLGYGPKLGIDEIVRALIQQRITPENHTFLEIVKGEVAAKFRKTNNVGQAIVSFLIITRIMEISSQIPNNPFSTLDRLPINVKDFLKAVINIQNASRIANGIIYGI
ncbi:MAG: hypothetical protein ACFFDW_13130 [Candidatus Thorarchaeota archaeon]